MTFISYAQNFEDVMLWRALKDIESGFYIDIGANDPEIDSVTKAFYDHGWRGINIEPVGQWFERLERERIKDINLRVAAGAVEEDLTLYEIPDTGLSTFDRSIAERHKSDQGYDIITHKVPVRTLTHICEQYHTVPIHFLKIDVEGTELQVLEGIDFAAIRPWIVVVESTLPNTQIEDCEHWEKIILSAGYEFVYFDGLNRFYLSQEHSERKKCFNSPPNYFDGFFLSGRSPFCFLQSKKLNILSESLKSEYAKTLQAEEKAQKLQNELEAAKVHTGQLTEQLNEKTVALSSREATLAEQRAHNQRLESEGNDAKARIAELNAAFKENLVRRHEAQIAAGKAEASAQKLQNELEAAKVHTGQLIAQLGITEGENVRIKGELIVQQNANHHHRQPSEAHEQQIQAIYQSYSWRITKPLRLLYLGLGKTISVICAIPKWIWRTFKWPFQLILAFMIRFTAKHPAIEIKVTAWLKRYPRLDACLCQSAREWRNLAPTLKGPDSIPKQVQTKPIVEKVADLSHLSPCAHQIYADLKAAIEHRQKENR